MVKPVKNSFLMIASLFYKIESRLYIKNNSPLLCLLRFWPGFALYGCMFLWVCTILKNTNQ